MVELFFNDKINLTISRSGNILEVELKGDGKNYFEIQIISPKGNFPNELAKSWRRR